MPASPFACPSCFLSLLCFMKVWSCYLILKTHYLTTSVKSTHSARRTQKAPCGLERRTALRREHYISTGTVSKRLLNLYKVTKCHTKSANVAITERWLVNLSLAQEMEFSDPLGRMRWGNGAFRSSLYRFSHAFCSRLYWWWTHF